MSAAMEFTPPLNSNGIYDIIGASFTGVIFTIKFELFSCVILYLGRIDRRTIH